MDNLGLKTTGDMLDTGSSPYGLLKERSIPATLSEPELQMHLILGCREDPKLIRVWADV